MASSLVPPTTSSGMIIVISKILILQINVITRIYIQHGKQLIHQKYIQDNQIQIGLEMIMVFIWMGSLLPPRHQQTIKDCEDYPGNRCFLLQDYHFKYYMEKYKQMLGCTEERLDRLIMDEKVDLLRLFYLYDKGGIYSDLDNKINYTCFQNLIQTKNLTQFFSQEQDNPTYPSNNFIYSPTPRHPNIEFVLSKVKEFQGFTDLNFVGTHMLRKIMENMTFVNIQQCVEHGYQVSWKWDSPTAQNLISPSQANELAICRRQIKVYRENNVTFEDFQICSQERSSCRQSNSQLLGQLENLKTSKDSCLNELNNEKQLKMSVEDQLAGLKSSSAASSEQFKAYKLKNEMEAANRDKENELVTNDLKNCEQIKGIYSGQFQICSNLLDFFEKYIEAGQNSSMEHKQLKQLYRTSTDNFSRILENWEKCDPLINYVLYISLGVLVSILIITLTIAVKIKRTNRTEHHHSAIDMAEQASLLK